MLMQRISYHSLVYFCLLVVTSCPQFLNGQELPNIVIIIPDDMGWSDVGYHGSHIKTPNIDKLARTGVKLTQHYVMPTCTPSRVGLLTGKYPSRYGVLGPDYGEVIDLGDPTMASILQKNGYYTALAGKWHMGSIPYTPMKYGFQSTYGYLDGQIDPYTHEYKTETKLTSRQSWHRNDEYLVEEGHATDLITAEAIRIIRVKRNSPFFLYVAYSVPHAPLNEDQQWLDYYKETGLFPSRQWFAASVTHMDDGIGQIIEALEESDQRDNTLILFLSDNGGQHSWHSNTEYRGAYKDKPHDVLGNNFPLRGWKSELYEGGIRVPALLNWPGKLAPRTVDLPIHVTDWLPTLTHLLNAETGDIQKMWDGQDIWSYLANDGQLEDERTFYWKTSKATAIRQGPWKLIIHHKTQEMELFNIDQDFRESRNLIDSEMTVAVLLQSKLKEIQAADRND